MSEKMREEFHKWCDSQGFASDRYEMCDLGEKYKHLCGEYVIPDSRIMWQAWQASRAALVVELPQKREIGYLRNSYFDGKIYGFNDCVDELAKLLNDAGVTYK